MSEKEIYAKIVEVIQEHEGADFSVSPELSLKDELGVDSVDLMEFIIDLEDTFAIEIPDEQIDHFKNISDIVTYIHGKLKK
ncbi:acyl carrier protein [Streptococcus sinensis]|uniref:Acyl carrier protein n=1 Tax=Streptococcus sinensis TaxID=176090 RepID=A0A0A0DFV3_9STRE|nr:acyl carrier protein [Streptococcus sinensis]KGM36738.1 Acyl carrier protein [Streptococcus sinensis]